jgi:hypothetical protein
MADEETGVSHEDLDAALEADAAQDAVAETESTETETTEETQQETQPPAEDQLPEEPDDNSERSKLGRKVKAMEDAVYGIQDAVSRLLESQTKPKKDEPEFEGDDFVTFEKLDAWQQQRVKQQAEANKAYVNGVRGTFTKLGQEYSEENWLSIVADAEKNIRKTGNPALDAQLSFTAAENRFLRSQLKQQAKPKNPLEKNKDSQAKNLGGETNTNPPARQAAMPKLDPHAAAFAAKMKSQGKWKDEHVADALEGDMPLNFGGKVTTGSTTLKK